MLRGSLVAGKEDGLMSTKIREKRTQLSKAQNNWAAGCQALAESGEKLGVDRMVVTLLKALSLSSASEVPTEHLWQLIGTVATATSNLQSILQDKNDSLAYRQWGERTLLHLRERPLK